MSVCVALELESGKYRPEEQASTALAEVECFVDLAEELNRQGVAPFSQFVVRDAELLKEMLDYAPAETTDTLKSQLEDAVSNSSWYDPQAGLASVSKLIELLPEHGFGPAVARDLALFERVLLEAARSGDRFRLVVT